jgi:hypothetical protein
LSPRRGRRACEGSPLVERGAHRRSLASSAIERSRKYLTADVPNMNKIEFVNSRCLVSRCDAVARE